MNTPAPFPAYNTKINNPLVKSGNTSDNTVYTTPPADGDWIKVSSGQTLTLDWTNEASPRLAGIYVDNGGILDLGTAPGNKVLKVGTILVNMGGKLGAGSCMNNVPVNGTLNVIFLDLPLDATFDPGQFSNGLLVTGGMVDMCGAVSKSAGNRLLQAKKGEQTLTCLDPIVNWNIGDTLFLPSCSLDDNILGSTIQDEFVTIQSINNNVITLTTPLNFDHIPLSATNGVILYTYVVNLSRNIVFKSENPNGIRGHCMFMKDMMTGMLPSINACHVLIKDMGRTTAKVTVTDPMVDSNGVLVPGTADNPRARYAWHSHRVGQAAEALQVWDTIAVWGALKWGFDNHDSNVNCHDCVAVQCEGSGFATERGSEIGTYTNCYSFRTTGSSTGDFSEEDRKDNSDFGWNGYGIWLQGPGVDCTGCVVAGHPANGIVVYTKGPQTNDTSILTNVFDSTLVTWAQMVSTPNNQIGIDRVPIKGVNNCTVFCSGITANASFDQSGASGIQFGGNNASPDTQVNTFVHSTITNSTIWACPKGVHFEYSINYAINNTVLVGDYIASLLGIDQTGGYSQGGTFTNMHIEGFQYGVRPPAAHRISAQLGDIHQGNYYFANKYDFYFQYDGGVLDVSQTSICINSTDSLTFGATSWDSQGQRLNYKTGVFNIPNYLSDNGASFHNLFATRSVLLPNGQQLFSSLQQPTAIPFPTTNTYPSWFPTEFVGLTTAQLLNDYNIVFNGQPPTTAVQNSNVLTDGWLGNWAGHTPCYQAFMSPYVTVGQSTSILYGDVLYYGDPTHQSFTDPAPFTPTPGTNIIRRTEQGQLTTFVFFAPGSTPPPTQVTTTTTVSGTISLPFKALVTADNGQIVNDGQVTFSALGVTSTVNVSNGQAVTSLDLPVSVLRTPFTLTATYAGGSENGSNVSVTI